MKDSKARSWMVVIATYVWTFVSFFGPHDNRIEREFSNGSFYFEHGFPATFLVREVTLQKWNTPFHEVTFGGNVTRFSLPLLAIDVLTLGVVSALLTKVLLLQSERRSILARLFRIMIYLLAPLTLLLTLVRPDLEWTLLLHWLNYATVSILALAGIWRAVVH